MKKIAIIAPETVPLPLKENYPPIMLEGNKEFDTKDKCLRATAPGKRSWKFAENLSKCKDFDVTLFVPNLNMPDAQYIDFDKINFDLKSYSFKAANWEWSEELDKRLIEYDFVIIQLTTGTGFQNCAVLPKEVNVIVDGWIPFPAELPCAILHYNRIYRKIFWSQKFIPQYQNLLRRANCVLYASDRQNYYYEGQFFMIQKLDWSSFKFSPLLKVPQGIDINNKIEKKPTNSDKLKLLWFGSAYPWYNSNTVIEKLKNNLDVDIDFVGVEHPRFKKVYDVDFKRSFEYAKKRTSNIKVVEHYCDTGEDLFPNYDAGIVLAQNWLEEKYAYRCRILDMVSYGFPVIINEGNTLYDELPFMRPALHPVSSETLVDDLIKIKEKKEQLEITNEELVEIQKNMNWETVLTPLVNYIERFGHDKA
jgi:hypothetical protein